MCQLNNIISKNVLVIGDVMLDTYYIGDVKRISPEAPVPVFKKKSERSVLGGAANVAANLVAARQNVSMMSIVGNDEVWRKLKRIFEEQSINTDLIFPFERHTTEKIRFMASNNQQVLRLDVEDTELLSVNECHKMLDVLENKLDSFDLIILSDYLKGLLTYEFTQIIIRKAKNKNIPVFIDVKDPKYEKYCGATLLKPNLKELSDLTGMPVDTDKQIIDASNELKNKCNVDYVLTTCGDRGMVLVSDNEPYSIPALNQEVFDVTGAGDTTIAYLGACIVNGMSMNESVKLANLAAGIQVSKVGTSSVYWSEIRQKISENVPSSFHKVICGKALESFRKDHDKQKIVFAYIFFDSLDVGVIRYLQNASKQGDLLVVGLNSDESLKCKNILQRRIKHNETERIEMLVALYFVDYVVLFDDDSPINLINIIKPDVLFNEKTFISNNN